MRARPHKREPTIALINIVFLMLVFFMVAGTLNAPQDRPLTLVQTAEVEGRVPPDVLVINADGQMRIDGAVVGSVAAAYDRLPAIAQVRLMPDRALSAAELVRVAAQLKILGAGRVMIVTERGLP
ncbi:biopolymer transporter ExbD [uncultured Roseobacter sp.]|uniref:ExbD/TolR family protein n=1 Tax=uncultured Roseobacter sp. TaxID=114847 RepID=UPI00262AD307|nr:biopolymer transporter ExbD [uncultured Roseobacter sp.]